MREAVDAVHRLADHLTVFGGLLARLGGQAAGMAGIKDAKISEATQKSLELLGKQKMELLKDVPGSIVWTRTGGVTLKGETF